MTGGPTQNYTDASATTWRARPVLAAVVRGGVVVGPLLLALLVGAAAARWTPASRYGLPTAVWLLLVVVITSGVLVALSRFLRRLVPLTALLKLSLVLPDRVPSRFTIARRTWSPGALDPADPGDGPGDGALDGAPDGAEDRSGAAWVLTLVGTLAAHDPRTRSHAERVQAYAALIGRELGLSADDVERLSWAALLHDVGKVHVPVEIINKDGRPTDEEWAQLQQHPHHGGELVRPLRDWLGEWLDGVEQHHERWDGKGYPLGLSGEDISLAARIVAVADTYDVITSARAYKKPMSAEQAKAEITRCAGAQFDPAVVRALLSVGIGRLRLVAGPSTLLAALPVLVAAPAQAVSTATAVAQVAGGHALTAVLAAGIGVSGGVSAAEVMTVPTAADTAVVVEAVPTSDGAAQLGVTRPSSSPRPTPTAAPAPALDPAPTSTSTTTPTATPATPATTPTMPPSASSAPASPPATAAGETGSSRAAAHTPSPTAPPSPSRRPSVVTPRATASSSGSKDSAAKDSADAAAKAAKDLAKAQADAAKDQAKAQADAAKDQAKAQADAAKDQADAAAKAARDLAKVQADAAKDLAKAQADAAKEQAKSQADAAKDLADKAKGAKDLLGGGSGGKG